jgi:hypothetical protein
MIDGKKDSELFSTRLNNARKDEADLLPVEGALRERLLASACPAV